MSASGFSPAGASALASASAPWTCCAASTSSARWCLRSSSTQPGNGPMADIALTARSPFAGLAVPGRYGASGDGAAPVLIAARPDLVLRNLSVGKGGAPDLAAAVRAVTGLALPSGPRRVASQGLALIGTAPSQFLSL